MLNSSRKIKQNSSEQVIIKIREDYDLIQNRYREFMTKRLMKSGIEVLGDLISFFESSPPFIGVACEKLRKQHGPNFSITTVKALLNLRTDITKEEKSAAMEICKSVIESYKDGTYDSKLKQKNGANAISIFQELDVT